MRDFSNDRKTHCQLENRTGSFSYQPTTNRVIYHRSIQARRQDSVTGGAEINFGRARAVYLCEFEGAREVCSSVDQMKNVKTKKKKKVFCTNIPTNSNCRLKIPAIFDEFFSKVQKKKKKSLRPKSFMISDVSQLKLRKNSSCSQILGR